MTNNNYTYENENFFETNNDNLIEIKNIFENKFFWERINTFFEIKVQPEEIEILHNFYQIPPQHMATLAHELHNYVKQDYLNSDLKVLENLKLSKQLKQILKDNDLSMNEIEQTFKP